MWEPELQRGRGLSVVLSRSRYPRKQSGTSSVCLRLSVGEGISPWGKPMRIVS